jgi:hypothetical protein
MTPFHIRFGIPEDSKAIRTPTPPNFLATRSAKPTAKDYDKALMILTIYADASHMLHADNKGHGGIVVTMESAPIATKSYKLKLITRSSTESELVTLEEAVTLSLWVSNVLNELSIGYAPPAVIMQDNDSTRAIAERGGNWSRTKHIFNRQQFVEQHIKSGNVRLERCPTQVMRADMLTKPCAPADIFRHRIALSII